VIRRANRSQGQKWLALYPLWLLILVTGLVTSAVIDADGDPTTVNSPSVVLTAKEATVSEKVAAESTVTEADVLDTGERTMGPLRQFAARLGRTRQLWHLRVAPARGP
jgi:hypothetical protein